MWGVVLAASLSVLFPTWGANVLLQDGTLLRSSRLWPTEAICFQEMGPTVLKLVELGAPVEVAWCDQKGLKLA